MTSDDRWGNTRLHLPADLHREEAKARIEAHVKDLLAETSEWPVLIDVPEGSRKINDTTLLWFIDYRTGPKGQTTRWRSTPAQHHLKAK
ncbi:hypothetical protein BVU76_21705 [Mycolicibacterium porcinum]|nr:hypothetical protein BVU76_21705 [Mycolicibacterium porcinum]